MSLLFAGPLDSLRSYGVLIYAWASKGLAYSVETYVCATRSLDPLGVVFSFAG